MGVWKLSRKPKNLTADAALKIWAARSSGPLENPGPEGYATPSYGVDDEASIVTYVETTEGFQNAKHGLTLKYVKGDRVKRRRDRIRVRLFELKLAARLRQHPWRPPVRTEELCGWDLAEQITAGANKELAGATRRLLHP